MHHTHHRRANPPKQPSPLIQLPIRHREKDKPKETIKSRAKQRQEIPHTRNDFGEDEGNEPDNGHGGDPHPPPENRVAVRVVRAPHDAEVEEFGADVGVDGADDEGGDDDEGEGGLFVGGDA